MILPPFNPPKLPEMTEWWTRCTYADVQRLILEVQHQRLTLWELRSCIADASRRARAIDPSLLEYGAPLRRLGYIVEKEIDRAAPFARMREPVAPFSDEWRAREELKSKCWESPDDTPPGTSPKSIPQFQRVTWAELREKWRIEEGKKLGRHTLEQRMALDIAYLRSNIVGKSRKLVDAARIEAEKSGVQLFALDRLKRLLEVEHEDEAFSHIV
ncbi:putative gP32 [Burkholderia pseudomallei]|uniref:hypothetical protein n=1 Tax=Burkholderia pseudomallei TaxID=28450 RepID=UPI000536FB69|nr:hypothetical protein [Burkholderia pseudomallei]KGX12655.1 putative gP32 [Burkholderia pseudomallei]KGX27701.1 putative gP32 [Burkholderia pseudomallei]